MRPPVGTLLAAARARTTFVSFRTTGSPGSSRSVDPEPGGATRRPLSAKRREVGGVLGDAGRSAICSREEHSRERMSQTCGNRSPCHPDISALFTFNQESPPSPENSGRGSPDTRPSVRYARAPCWHRPTP